MVSSLDEDAFLDEVLGLFALEAQEWISQTNTALLELEHHPASQRNAKLYETISCGIANLAGSAATVELRDLERLAFSLLPLLQLLQDARYQRSSLLATLRRGLNVIIETVQRLSESKSDAIAALDALLAEIDQAKQAALSAPPAADQPVPAVAASGPPAPVMDRLSELQQRCSAASDPTRHMADAVIRKARRDYGERGWKYIDGSTVLQILQELAQQDEKFLEELRQRLPTIQAIFSDLQHGNAEAILSNGRFERVVEDVHWAHDLARAVDAKNVMLFFHGLQTFLSVLCKKTAPISPARIDTVEARLRTVLASAEQWVEIGKMERRTIQQLVGDH